MAGDNELKKRLILIFKVEAKEHINAISDGILQLEKQTVSPEDKAKVLEMIAREAHSLKGAARAVSLTGIVSVCQSLETVLFKLKKDELELNKDGFDKVHQALDVIMRLVSSPEGNIPVSEVISGLQGLMAGRAGKKTVEEKKLTAGLPVVSEPAVTAPPVMNEPFSELPVSTLSEDFSDADNVRINVSKLDAMLLQAEEMITVKLTYEQKITEIKELKKSFEEWEKGWTELYSDIQTVLRALSRDKGFHQTKFEEFINWNLSKVRQLRSTFSKLTADSEQELTSISNKVNNLLTDTKKSLMLPFSTIFATIPKMVRDIARQQGKEIEVNIKGASIEIYKKILEEIKDPLIHLIRNSIDHGIELPEERRQKGKPAFGTINITVSQENNRIELFITDDGRGIDSEKLLKKALEAGFISHDDAEKLKDQEIKDLIFQSGFSTSPIITDLSGRGLGLAIVREKIDKLRGTVMVKSQPGKGTAFILCLPLMIATFRGIFVKASGRTFVIPVVNVLRAIHVRPDEIRTVENKETIVYNDQVFSFAYLADVLGLPVAPDEELQKKFIKTVIINNTEKVIAFGVDEILYEQEVIVKKLGKQLNRVRNISGAAIMGSGMVIPILNINDLLKSVVKGSVSRVRTTQSLSGSGSEKRSVLVAEDSITSRMLLKNILETAGYHVKTTVDGVEAFTALKEGNFDLLVSDVEMPRMNGFELTTKIRSEKKLADLPVILVTSLDSKEDKEKGIEAGANAYIVKSSFDQTNLLNIIPKLI